MPIATISAKSDIKTSNFGVVVTLDMPIEDLPKSIITLRPILGNGITGVDFSVSGSGTSWNLMFVVPAEQDGTFEISILGEVTVVGESMPEAVTVTQPLVVRYDTTTAVTASWGEIDYRDDGEIVLPVVFGEDITHLHKSDFTLAKVVPMGVDADDVDDVWEVIEDYWLVQRVGVARTFYLHFQMALDKKGTFSVELTGYVYKTAQVIRDEVSLSTIEIPYSTVEPELVDRRVIRTGERIDVILQYDVACTLTDPIDEFGDGAQRADFLDYAGTNLDPPNFYRKVDNDYPTIPLPAELPEADWTQADVTIAEATIYLIRWGSVSENEEFNVTIKPGFVRGPVR